MNLSIVIPIHNEADFVADAVKELARQVADLEPRPEILLVENGSTDDTRAIAGTFESEVSGLRVLALPEPDYGAAMREGFLAAKGDWVVAFDIDYFSRAFIDAVLRSEADVILASKRDPEAEDQRTFVRRLGTSVFNLLLRILFGSRVTDTHGMKAIRRTVIEEFVPQTVSSQDLFDTELVLRAERAGATIQEVPAVVEELRPARSSFLKRVPRTLAGLMRLRRLLGRP